MRRLGLAVIVTALSGTGAAAQPPGHTKVPKRSGARVSALGGAAAARSAAIRRFANAWRGTSYRWGGTTRSGIDCSAYTRQMYRDTFGVELPRVTRQQINLGVDVPIIPGALGSGFEPGDMFFYVDPTGIPNHVVVYMGGGQFTHSASGRGVVIEGFKALWGRRIVGRRVLFPAKGGATGQYAPIPPAPPFKAVEVPCPPNIRARPDEIRKFRNQPLVLAKIKYLPERQLCEWKALSTALRTRGGKGGPASATVVDEHIAWIESIDSLKDEEF